MFIMWNGIFLAKGSNLSKITCIALVKSKSLPTLFVLNFRLGGRLQIYNLIKE